MTKLAPIVIFLSFWSFPSKAKVPLYFEGVLGQHMSGTNIQDDPTSTTNSEKIVRGIDGQYFAGRMGLGLRRYGLAVAAEYAHHNLALERDTASDQESFTVDISHSEVNEFGVFVGYIWKKRIRLFGTFIFTSTKKFQYYTTIYEQKGGSGLHGGMGLLLMENLSINASYRTITYTENKNQTQGYSENIETNEYKEESIILSISFPIFAKN